MFVLVTGDAFAQGLYVEKGFGVTGGYSSEDDVTVLSGDLGYSVNRNYEFGFRITRAANDKADLNALALSPRVTVYPLKQSESNPVTLGFSGSYSLISFSGGIVDDIKDLGGKVSGSGFTMGGLLAHTFVVVPSTSVVPFAEMEFVSSTVKGERAGFSEYETVDNTVFTFGISLTIEAGEKSIFALTPMVSFSNGETSFGFGAGLLIAK